MTQNFSRSNITTYGALILPFDKEKILEDNKVKNNPKTVNGFKGKLRSALKLSDDENLLIGALKHPTQTFSVLSSYMKDERAEQSGLTTVIGSKFSGIAVAQAITSGKVTTQEALDYLFMGFAPALGIQGSLMGYSGLSQMKDALAEGSIDVGAFISGFTRTLKGVVDFKDMLKKKNDSNSPNVIEFDLTISHSESYQSETPDRRVQSGQSLNEYIHNMPDTFQIQCALQDGKRYSIPEFRAILKQVQLQKDVVALVLGNDYFDNLVLTDFSPSSDCSKSGFDYTLGFKKITRSDVDTTKEVTIQQAPTTLESGDKITTVGGLSGASSTDIGSVKFDAKQLEQEMNIPITPQTDDSGYLNSTLRTLKKSMGVQ